MSKFAFYLSYLPLSNKLLKDFSPDGHMHLEHEFMGELNACSRVTLGDGRGS